MGLRIISKIVIIGTINDHSIYIMETKNLLIGLGVLVVIGVGAFAMMDKAVDTTKRSAGK